MKKKKKRQWMPQKQASSKFSLIIIIAIVLVAVCFILTASGHQSEYLKNYTTNFKRNIASIAKKMNITVPESWSNPPAETINEEQPNDITFPPESAPPVENSPSAEGSIKPTAAETLAPKAEIQSETHMLAMVNAASNEYVRYDNMLVCADKTTLTAYRENAQVQWSVSAQISNPILDSKGKYIALAEKGGRKLMLFKGKKQVYSVQTNDDIIRMSVSANGDIALVTEKTAYMGSVVVYNKKGSEVFVWNSGTDSILDADISPRGRRLAISLLSAANGIKSTISFFDITKTESNTSVSYDNCIIFDLKFAGETLSAIGDNQTIGLSSSGKQQWQIDYQNKTLTHYQMEDTGVKLFAFDNNNISELSLVSAGGKVSQSLQAEIIPDYIDIYSGYCAYNSGRNIIFGKISGSGMKQYPCTKDIKKLIILDDKTVAAVYGTSVEFINIRG